MDDMERKYQENMKAGVTLSSSDRNLYTSSIHCYYYAVLQYMKFRLAHVKDGISYNDQSEIAKGDGTHEFVINALSDKMETTSHNIRSFKEDVRDLKNKRVQADYNERFFTQEESLECRAQAERLISNINRFTKIAV